MPKATADSTDISKNGTLGDADVSERLLSFLRTELDMPGVEYKEPPSRILGGYGAHIFTLVLSDAHEAFAGPLILRINQPHRDHSLAMREKAVHDVVTGLGYPAPRVPYANTDTSVLGGAFLIMERLAGEPLLKAQPFNLARVLAEQQVRLHALTPPATLSGMPDDGLTLRGLLARLEEAAALELPGLRNGVNWLVDHIPVSSGGNVICHGDFHPLNILSDGNRVTGVIDWPNAFLGPPEYDVAATKVAVSFARPLNASLLERALLLLVPVLVRRYLSAYRRLSGRSLDGIESYEALACMRYLVSEGQHILHDPRPVPLDLNGLTRRFRKLTGVGVELPQPEGAR